MPAPRLGAISNFSTFVAAIAQKVIRRRGSLLVTRAGHSFRKALLVVTIGCHAYLFGQSVTVSPTTLAFGNQPVAITTSAKTVTLRNGQSSSLTISSITASGDYSETNNCGTSLAASRSCTINVTFTPSTTGNRSGTLTVTDSASNSPQTVSLTGTGLLQATAVPANLAFGNEAVGTSSTAQSVTVTNNLSTALAISSIAASGDYSQTNTCGASLAANTTCSVSVTFTPSTTGNRAGTLTITDAANNSPQTVSLTGTGLLQASTAPSTLAFGNQAVGTSSTALTTTLTNNLASSLTISSISASSNYSEADNCGGALTPAGSCVISVVFSPTSTGNKAGTLTITDSANNSPQTVSLTGTGTALPHITNLSTSSGTVGTSVTITGTGFETPQGASTVTFGGATGTTSSWGQTSITVAVPSQAITGNVVVTVNGGASNGVAFTVVPNIQSLSSNSGQVGSSITISGTGFGPLQGSSTVAFNGVTGSPSSWSASSIAIPIPAGATTGNVVVTAGGTASNGVAFTVLSSFVSTTGQMQAARYGQTATELANGQILVAGGLSSSGVLTDAELYSLTAQTFTEASPMNVPRWLHTATLLNDGTVLIAGGSSVSSGTTLNSAEIYDPTAGTFTLLSNNLNTARVGHTATLLSNGQVLIVGGYDPNTGIISDSELYDPVAQVFIDLGDTNTPRYHHTATLLQNGQVLIAGGETDPVPSGAYNTAEIFNPATWTFSPLSVTMNSAREGHTATLLNDGTILITGGDLPPNGSLNTAEIYNSTSNAFTAISATMTSPRIFHDAVLLNGGQVLLSGGENDSSGSSTALNTAETYNPTAQTFTATAGNMISIRDHQTVTLLNDGTVLEAGGTDGTNIFNTAEIYTTSQLASLVSISVSPSSPSVPLGSQQLLVATGTFAGGGTQVLSSVLWSSSSTSVSTVSGDASDSGYVNTLTQGTATITASAAGVSGSASVTVPSPTLVSITINPLNVAMPLGTTQQFTATGTYSDGSTQDLTSTATWTSSSSFATVTSGGLVTAAALGTSTIQASSGSQSNSTSVTIGAPALVSVAVSPATATLAVGLTQQYQATGTYTDGSTQNLTGSASWYAVPQTSATVSSSGLVTGVGQGSANITAAYGGFSGVSALTVGGPNLVSISVSPGSASVTPGSDQQFVAIANYSDGSSQDITSTASWSSSSGSIATVSSTGLATGIAGGSATLMASSNSVTGSAALTVAAGTVALNTSRYQHSATLLNNGSVLFAGGVNCPSAGSCTYLTSAEVYNPNSGTVTNTGSMAAARSAPAVLLGNGTVLIAGGYSCDTSGNCTSLSSAELYNPATGTFGSAGNMTTARYQHTMALLPNGQVLIAGGETCSSATACTALSSAELYNPASGTFTATGSLNAARFSASAVTLGTGQVLVAGGFDGTNYPAAAEVYNPSSGTFATTGTLNTPRANDTATLLNNGQVLIAGGSTCSSPGCPTAITEMFNGSYFYYPTYPTGNMTVPRSNETATILTNGKILLAGGYDSCSTTCTSDATTELFDPVAFTFTSAQGLTTGRSGQTSTILTDGSVLIAGGINNGTTLSSTDSYEPASLALPQLASITVAPSFDTPVALGTNVFLTATGYSNYGPLYGMSAPSLQSVVWSSSSPSVATVSNAAGSAGIVNALTSGTATISATNGTIRASTQITVTAPLVSIAISPANPTVSVGSTQPLQLTATGTFSDNSTIDLTSNVTWASSNTSVAGLTVIPGNPPIVVPASSGNANITAVYAGISGGTTVTVNAPLPPVPPNIITASPTSGTAGTQVAVSGSGFGATQGSGTVLIGTNLGLVVSWTASQIVANVPTGSSSGVVQVLQTNGASNSVPFTINTASIVTISPNNGLPGTQVTISGSGFGATQGAGNVWLGTAPAIVNSWSDGQVVATVAAGAATGSVLILQSGVVSNAVPFTINVPYITGISPNAGSAGTTVTVTGSGFGATQGNGSVLIGSTNGYVMGWSNTQVIASVADNSLSGIVQIQQNGITSNGLTFTVNSTEGSPATALVPNQITMVVGGTQSIEAVNQSGQSITGLSWTSSNTAVATLSTDDPPIITAVGVGTSTITAGGASALVTVLAGATLPTGTVIWSNPGDGSGVQCVIPAVPSSTGVADVFAVNSDGSVQAITSSGLTAWTAANVNVGCSSLTPDFQGGLVVNGQGIYRLDGMTGQPSSWTYTSASGNGLSTPVVHTSGTIFTIDGSMVVGINPTTGQPFSVGMESSTSSSTGICPNRCSSPLPPSGEDSSYTTAPLIGSLIIAGDGYAYVPYMFEVSGYYSTDACTPGCGCSTSYSTKQSLRLLRIGPGGDSYEISLGDFSSAGWNINCWSGYSGSSYSATATVPTLITNADQGVLASYSVTYNNSSPSFYLATTSGTSVVSNSQVTTIPGQTSPVQPTLQRQDGNFIGTVSSSVGSFMVGFSLSSGTLFTVSNDTPQVATADNGMIGSSGVTYDQNGNANGQLPAMPTQSILGNQYQAGSIQQALFVPYNYATSYAATMKGNPAAAATYIPTLGAIYRSQIANDAKSYVGSTKWIAENYGGKVTCNIFVSDVLAQASNECQLNIPSPLRPNLSWWQSNFGNYPALARDWANPNNNYGCWKMLPAGPNGALPGDVIATGWPPNGPDATGHVGIVVEPNAGNPNYKDSSAADVPPYWWTASEQASFVRGTVTLTDYGFRQPGYDPSNPLANQGLQQDSHVRRFSCY